MCSIFPVAGIGTQNSLFFISTHGWLASKAYHTKSIRLYCFHHDLFLVPIFDIPLMQNSRASQSSSAISFLLPSRYPKKTVAESMKRACSNMVNLPFKINDCDFCYLLEGFFFISLHSLTPSLCLLSFSHMLTHPPPPHCSCLCVILALCLLSLCRKKKKTLTSASLQDDEDLQQDLRWIWE